MMRPLSFSAQLQLNHTAPLSRTEKRASQRSGFNLTPPQLQKEIDEHWNMLTESLNLPDKIPNPETDHLWDYVMNDFS